MTDPATFAPYLRESVTGVVLAGGLGRRMGGEDKGLVELAGRAMVEYVLDALRPQVGPLLINANRNLDRYGAYGQPVIGDTLQGYLGPLAGVLSALQRLETDFLVTAPCDAPLIAPDLVARLYAAGRAGMLRWWSLPTDSDSIRSSCCCAPGSRAHSTPTSRLVAGR
jgi:molybdenum cofactor guanylyltransferase